MPILNLVGFYGYTFQIGSRGEDWMDGASDLMHLKSKVCSHLRNKIKEQIYNEQNICMECDICAVLDKFQKSTLFKKWLKFDKEDTSN